MTTDKTEEKAKEELAEVKPEVEKEEVKNAEVIEEAPAEEAPAEEAPAVGLADIAALFGLSADVSADEVLQAVKSLVDQVAAIETAKIEAEAEEAMDGYEVENREAFKQLYVKNRETATAVLSTLKKVTNKQVVTAQKVDDKLVLNRAVKPQPQLSKADIMATYQSLHGQAASAYLRAHLAELG